MDAVRFQDAKRLGAPGYVHYQRRRIPIAPPLTGLRLREVLGVEPDRDLFIADASGDDPIVRDTDRLDWAGGDLHLYSVPRKINGA